MYDRNIWLLSRLSLGPRSQILRLYPIRSPFELSKVQWPIADIVHQSLFRVQSFSWAEHRQGIASALGMSPQCIPAAERARAVSLTTSGMYLGSAGAMMFLPSVAGAFGGHVLMRLNGALGLLWLLAWVPLSRRMPSVCVCPHRTVCQQTGERTNPGRNFPLLPS